MFWGSATPHSKGAGPQRSLPNFWDPYLRPNSFIYGNEIWYGNTGGVTCFRGLATYAPVQRGRGLKRPDNFFGPLPSSKRFELQPRNLVW